MAIKIRHYQKEKEIFDALASKPNEPWTIIVPNQKKIGILQKELSFHQEKIKIVTLAGFLQRLYENLVGEVKILSPLEQELLMEMVTLELKDELEFFHRVHKYPGTAKKLRGFFSSLLQYRMSIKACKAPSEFKKDLEKIYEHYNNFISSRDLFDGDLLTRRAFETVCKELDFSQENIIVDTLYYNTPLDQEILGYLLKEAQEAYIYLDIPFLPEGEEEDFISCLKKYNSLDLKALIAREENNKKYFTFFNPEEEVKAVAGKIQNLIKAGTKTEDILIITTNLMDYQPLIHELFPSYGLYADFSKGLPLAASPLTHLVKSFFNLVDNPYSRHLLYQFFSSKLVDYHALDFEVIDREARRLNFNDLELLLLDKESLIKDELGQKQADILLKFIKEELLPFRKARKAQDFVDLSLSFLQRIGLLTNLLTQPSWASHSLLSEDFIVLNKICTVFTEVLGIFTSLQGTDKIIEFASFKRYFLKLISEKEYYLPETKGGIPVTNLLNFRGLKTEHLFFLGATEGNFPQNQGHNFLLPDFLEGKEVMRQGELQLYGMIYNAQKLIITCPSLEEGKQVNKSPLLAFLQEEDWPLSWQGEASESSLWALSQKASLDLWQEHAEKKDLQILQMVSSRYASSPEGIYDGFLDNFSYDIGQAVFSVSQLEDYLRCPIMYFFKRILMLKPREEVEEELGGADFGTHIHRILECFGRAEGFKILRKDKREAALLLKDLIDKVLEEFKINLNSNLFIKARYENWWSGLEDEEESPGIFVHFLEEESRKLEWLEPYSFEYIFGPQAPENLKVGPWPLAGRIDRIDKVRGANEYIIYDYKTGGYPSKAELEEKRSLQLPIYLLALATSKEFEGTELAGLYYSLNARQKTGYSTLIGKQYKKIWPRRANIELEELGGLEEYEKFFSSLAENLKEGNFPLTSWTPQEAKCIYCDYRLICRYNYRQSRRD